MGTEKKKARIETTEKALSIKCINGVGLWLSLLGVKREFPLRRPL